jgi:hypothetical protein
MSNYHITQTKGENGFSDYEIKTSAAKEDGSNSHTWMESPATTTACLGERFRVALRRNDEV